MISRSHYRLLGAGSSGMHTSRNPRREEERREVELVNLFTVVYLHCTKRCDFVVFKRGFLHHHSLALDI